MSIEKIILDYYGIPYLSNSINEFNNVCLICGLSIKEITQEDVVPLWMQREFQLFHKIIILTNETHLPFRKIKIPCCSECNNGELSQIENKVKSILNKDILLIDKSEEYILFQWFLKIFNGLYLKSSTLLGNRKSKQSKTIIPAEKLKILGPTYSLLKTIKYPVNFVNFKPYSLFKFKLKSGNDTPLFFIDNFYFPTIGFAYKKSAFILAINEGGIVKDRFIKMNKLNNSEINTNDLLFYFCKVLTARHLVRDIYNYLSIQGPLKRELRISKVLLPSNENRESLMPWDKELFNNYLRFYCKKLDIRLSFKNGLIEIG